MTTVTKQTATTTISAARERRTEKLVGELADTILAHKAQMAIAEKEYKALAAELLALTEVGDTIVRPGGKLTVTERIDLIADVETLQAVASRSLFKSLTKVVFDVPSYRALLQLGKSTPEVDEVVGEKHSAPFLVTTVAKS